MSNFWKSVTERWQDSANVVLGVWLILSPWILGFTGAPMALWNAVLLGLVIGGAALAALISFSKWEEWADMAFGVWLVISPWVLGFAAALPMATWNFVVVGVLAFALAAWSLQAHRPQTG